MRRDRRGVEADALKQARYPALAERFSTQRIERYGKTSPCPICVRTAHRQRHASITREPSGRWPVFSEARSGRMSMRLNDCEAKGWTDPKASGSDPDLVSA